MNKIKLYFDMNFLIVGAGFSGVVLSRELVKGINCNVTIIDKRPHIGGNCYTERDVETNIMEHVYGPHIFNTNREDVWNYVNKLTMFKPYINRVKSICRDNVFSMPINLHTINQFFNKTFHPKEAELFISTLGDLTINNPQNFEEQALKMIGDELYYSFFYGYTKKQWGCEPKELPVSLLKRLPIRFNYDDNYYSTKYQGIPEFGYVPIFNSLINHENIKLELNTEFNNSMIEDYDHVFFTGPIDSFFQFSEGRLGYRTVYFNKMISDGDFQGNAVINYPETNVPYTRIHEHKHFTPWEQHDKTIYFEEYSKETESNDVPYYPKRLSNDLILLEKYIQKAKLTPKLSFLGRLGTYQYINMDQSIGDALDFSKIIIDNIIRDKAIPTFLKNN